MQDPEINSGRPVIKNTRVFVDLIIGHLEQGMPIKEICQEYSLTEAQVQAVKNLRQDQIQYVKGYLSSSSSHGVHMLGILPRLYSLR